MDPLQRFGATIRAVRIKRGWRQVDVGARAGVHRSLVASIERGHVERVSVGAVLQVARALDVRVSLVGRWRGGDLDRLVSGRHGKLHEAVSRWFADRLLEWTLVPEVSFSIFGERGIIDILAWHPDRRALLIIELKTDIVDVNALVGVMDQRRRLAREILHDSSWDWDPLTISTWVLVARGRTNQGRLAAHRSLLRRAFPVDGRTIDGWLRRPDRSIDALSLWASPRDSEADADAPDLAARHRVRRPSPVRPPRARATVVHVPGVSAVASSGGLAAGAAVADAARSASTAGATAGSSSPNTKYAHQDDLMLRGVGPSAPDRGRT